MKRTSFMLPEELRRKARKRAEEIGVSFGDLMRRALEAELGGSARSRQRGKIRVRPVKDARPGVPDDLSANLNHYLYGAPKKKLSS